MAELTDLQKGFIIGILHCYENKEITKERTVILLKKDNEIDFNLIVKYIDEELHHIEKYEILINWCYGKKYNKKMRSHENYRILELSKIYKQETVLKGTLTNNSYKEQ